MPVIGHPTGLGSDWFITAAFAYKKTNEWEKLGSDFLYSCMQLVVGRWQ